MRHPSDMDGVLYTGRQSGLPCLALFGDDKSPRGFQQTLKVERLGKVTEWNEVFRFLDETGTRVIGAPSAVPARSWST